MNIKGGGFTHDHEGGGVDSDREREWGLKIPRGNLTGLEEPNDFPRPVQTYPSQLKSNNVGFWNTS